MATTYGITPIVTEGLIFAVDPINDRSYVSGSATVTDQIGGKSGTVLGSGLGVVPLNGLWDMDESTDTGITFLESADFNFGTGDFAVDVWAKANTSGATGGQTTRIVCADKNTNTTDWLLYYTGAEINWYSGAINSSVTVSAGVLYHLVYTRISGTLKAYRDGVEVDSDGYTNNLSTTTGFGIGRTVRSGYTNAGLLDGAVGPVKIYKGKGLTAAEVLQNYNALKGRFA